MSEAIEINEGTTSSPTIALEPAVERPLGRARVTGAICILCSFATIGFGFLLPFLYFPFLLFSAILGMLAFSDVWINKKGMISSVLLLLVVVLVVMLFLSLPLSLANGNFLIFYGLLSVLVPIILMIVASHKSGLDLWKTLVPLALPVLFFIAVAERNARAPFASFLLLPLGWGLLGLSAFLGKGSEK